MSVHDVVDRKNHTHRIKTNDDEAHAPPAPRLADTHVGDALPCDARAGVAPASMDRRAAVAVLASFAMTGLAACSTDNQTQPIAGKQPWAPGAGNGARSNAGRRTVPSSTRATALAARPATQADALRFLNQATCGASQGDIDRLMQIGYGPWLDEQFAMPSQHSHVQQVRRVAANRIDEHWTNRPTIWDVNDSMWLGLMKNDQLRQRIMFALSQIFVVSLRDGSTYYLGSGLAAYVDMLYAKGFGNWRDLIEGVALSTAMGSYLSHIYNREDDHLNTFVPFDTASYNRYATVRGGVALARPAGGALATTVDHGGLRIALNDALPGVRSLYDAKRLAVLASVGPLMAPSTKADLAAGRVPYPTQIGSHNDQANTWQALTTSSPYGWGGRIGDMLASGNGASANFTTISGNGGYSLFLIGGSTSPFAVSDGGIPSAFFDGDPNMTAAITGGGSSTRGNLLERAYMQVHEVLRDGAARLQENAIAEDIFAAPPGQNVTAAQLRTVARIIGAHQALGVKRQVFYVDMGGFDTHGDHVNRHAGLMRQLNDAIVYFDTLLEQLNMRDKVTLFSTSEFGRTYNSNGDGTDHGWGSHHVVYGGAVKGGQIYGALPVMEPDGPDFIDSWAMIPKVAVEQYGATLARWMGVSSSVQDDIFPNLRRFSVRDLGFLNRTMVQSNPMPAVAG